MSGESNGTVTTEALSAGRLHTWDFGWEGSGREAGTDGYHIRSSGTW